MSNLKLCYGLRLDAVSWAEGLGVQFGKANAKLCRQCNNSNPQTNNFCGNCGSDLRNIPDEVNAADIIQMTIESHGKPPRPLEMLAGRTCIYLCQVLGSGSAEESYVDFQRPINRHPWESIGEAIKQYASLQEPIAPYLFAIDEKGGE